MLDALKDTLCWFGVFYLIFHFVKHIYSLTRIFTTRRNGQWTEPYEANGKDARS